MVRLSRRWKLYLIYTFLVMAGMTLVGFVSEAQLEKRIQAHLKEDVLLLAGLIGKALPDSDDPSILDAFCRDYRKTSGVRITIIRKDGRVIGESDSTSIGMENHLARSEVQEALTKGTGTSLRRSETLRADMLYAALFLKDKGKIVRLAMPMSKVKTVQDEVMIFFSLAIFLTPVLAIIIAFFFTQYRRPKGEN
jgi:two-component system phosphate regulon sensor histidine kinase PhoR